MNELYLNYALFCMQIYACSKYFTIVRRKVNYSFTFLKKIMTYTT